MLREFRSSTLNFLLDNSITNIENRYEKRRGMNVMKVRRIVPDLLDYRDPDSVQIGVLIVEES